jgi:alkylresorcinol/alkylpyrone synthase
MPTITAVATAVPPHRVDQTQAQEFARKHFANRFSDIGRLMPIFTNTGIESRYFSAPVDWLDRSGHGRLRL